MRPTETADRVADVLDALANAEHGLSVTELAAVLGVHKTTASRLLATMALRGLVRRDPPNGRYRLGLTLVRLGTASLGSIDVVRAGSPVLQELMERTGETTYLAVPDHGGVLYVEQVTPRRAVVASDRTGWRGPLHCSSSGKVFAAFGAVDDLDAVLAGPLPVFARRTIVDPARFLLLLEQVRRQGYATSTDELEEGLTSVAAPVFGAAGDAPVAALGIAGPTSRLRARELSHLSKLTVEAAGAVGRRIG